MDRGKLGKGIMELVGTGILLLTIQVSGGLGAAMAPVAIGVVLIAIVYAGGPISGAHYNPAVSLAVMLRGKMSMPEMITYWAFQIVGGYLGALLGGIICGSFAVISVGGDSTGTQAFLAEVVFTFLLCFVVLGVATHSKADDNSYYGAAIGLVVMSGAITVGPISGGAFNPAVALGLGLSKGLANMAYVVVTVVANLIGGALAAGCFYIVAPDQFDAVGATAGETANLV
jgi:aquaporin Z